ncbi:hypothetical protein IQ06DRAFT_236435 [Phaeosphaeriaceae sp. SRC1lsM3a]|nr:hypothetical protein IQ06DRAFT_236435 [Stagonospora sp. SRC1lsM3a]
MRFSIIILAPLAAGTVSAICPGFSFGIGNQIKVDGILSQWRVYNNRCGVVETWTTCKNPCNQ